MNERRIAPTAGINKSPAPGNWRNRYDNQRECEAPAKKLWKFYALTFTRNQRAMPQIIARKPKTINQKTCSQRLTVDGGETKPSPPELSERPRSRTPN